MDTNNTPQPKPVQRAVIRTFVLFMSAMMVLDVLPWGTGLLDAPKKWLAEVTCRLGIEQGPWSMFAPNPATRTCWWTAELTDCNGQVHEWSSPYWATSGGRQKFFQYRYMIFDDRLGWSHHYPATSDFADYLARQHAYLNGPNCPNPSLDPSVVLYCNTLDLVRPPDGQLPTPENITFVAASEAVARSD